jgi:glutamate formiminotransferase/formiminotetrahydrofolate cyclodeaminase
LRVTGSELIGMAPKETLLDAGKFYLRQQGKHIGLAEHDIIHIAVLSLGLNDTSPFNPHERIIEYAMQDDVEKLVDLTIDNFVHELSTDSPAPGGGSVSALSGALSAALSSMVANLTYGKKQYRRFDKTMEDVAMRAQRLQERYVHLIDADTDAFNDFMSAMRLPKHSENDQQIRHAAMQSAAQKMTDIPLTTLRLTTELLELAEQVVKKGNENAASDAGVAAVQAEAAALGAYFNVKINLPHIDDNDFVQQTLAEADDILTNVQNRKKRLVRLVLIKMV